VRLLWKKVAIIIFDGYPAKPGVVGLFKGKMKIISPVHLSLFVIVLSVLLAISGIRSALIVLGFCFSVVIVYVLLILFFYFIGLKF